jgi:DNA-binding transcriptional LysR family regulator
VNLLEAMRIYVRVVERASISKAARDLDIGQPTASERIERLEKYLGCRLLLRNTRVVKCTPEGDVFYDRSKTILSATERAIAEVSNGEQELRGTIRIGAPHCLGEVILPEALRLVRSDLPQLNIDLALNDRVVDLTSEGVDIAFRIGERAEGSFIATQIARIKRVLVASPDYLARHGSVNHPADLINHPFIRLKDAFAADQLPLEHTSGLVESVPIRTAIATNHWRPIYEMVTVGLGIGILEAYACVEVLSDGRLIRVLSQCEVPQSDLHVLIQAQRPVPARVRMVADILQKSLPKMLDMMSDADV